MRKIQNTELGRLSIENFKQVQKKPFIFLLDNVRSMNNIGSVFRTADAFRCTSIGLCGLTATPPHREIRKTALGAEDSMDWFYNKEIVDAVKTLKSDGYIIAAIEQVEGGILLNQFRPEKEKKYAFIFGHEINGVSETVLQYCDLYIEIPQHGTKHSLNVAVAAGIVAWQFYVSEK